MNEPRAANDLQLDEDLPFQRRNWRAQRVGWLVMALLLLAALLGAFGRGPLSSGTATSARGTLRVDYDRITRRGAPTTLYVNFLPSDGAASTASLRLLRDFALRGELRTITPEPAQAVTEGDFIRFDFPVADPSRPVKVAFLFEPRAYNWAPVEIQDARGERVRFGQFILP